ncbi:MAG: hypothetical protein C0595_10345 [Marinilabiliales bacterium]|nr:MAG: hypothetical protein C0595_10345 [Marinilabiliales bacterium]
MKIRIISILAGVLISLSVFSQDYIYLKNGDRLETIITDQTKTAIIYQIFGSTQEDLKLVDKQDVKMIAYANGKIDDFSDNDSDHKIINSDFKKNLIAYHLADLLINNFTISYERILNNGKVGIKIPFSLGYDGDYEELGDFQNKFYSGVSINFYPTGQGSWRFFMGPEIRLGQGHVNDYIYNYDTGYGYEVDEDAFYFKFHINNGVMFSPIPELSLAASVSLGIRYVESDLLESKIRTNGAASFNMIYRF